METAYDLARQFLLDGQRRGLADSTIKTYSGELDRWFKWLTYHQLGALDVGKVEITEYVHRKTVHNHKPKPRRIRSRLMCLKSFYRWCFEEEYTEVNLTERVRDIKIPRPQADPIPPEHWVLIWPCLVGPRARCAMALAFYCGLRTGEIENLMCEQIGPRVINHLLRKGGETVMLPWLKMITIIGWELPELFPKGVIDAVISIKHVASNFEKVWSEGFNEGWLRKQLADACMAAGVPIYHPHQARASAATNMLRADVLPHHAKWLLDIKKWETLEYYVKSGRLEFYEWFDRKYTGRDVPWLNASLELFESPAELLVTL